MPVDRKLERFLAAIMSEGDNESRAIYKEIEEKQSSFMQKAEDEILSEVYTHVHSGTNQIRIEAGRRVSKSAFDNKKELYQRRSAIAEEIFELVRKKVEDYVRSAEYPGVLEQIAKRAKKALQCDDNIFFLLRPDDMVHADGLKKVVGGAFSEGEIELGGLIAFSEINGLLVDLTYDAAMERIEDMFGELSDFGSTVQDDSWQG